MSGSNTGRPRIMLANRPLRENLGPTTTADEDVFYTRLTVVVRFVPITSLRRGLTVPSPRYAADRINAFEPGRSYATWLVDQRVPQESAVMAATETSRDIHAALLSSHISRAGQ